MRLSQKQYDDLMYSYAERREMHRRELEKKRAVVYEKLPAYRELDEMVPEAGRKTLERRLLGLSSDSAPTAIAEITAKTSTRKIRVCFMESSGV